MSSEYEIIFESIDEDSAIIKYRKGNKSAICHITYAEKDDGGFKIAVKCKGDKELLEDIFKHARINYTKKTEIA